MNLVMNKEDNILIAEFMGYVVSLPMESVCGFVDDVEYFPLLDLKYDKSWDWLMLVVDKIENILLDTDNCFNVTIGSGVYCTIQDAYGKLIEIGTCQPEKIDAVHEAVIEFIKYHNKQNQ